MSGYAFISNSTKPNKEKLNSREEAKLGNVNRPCLKAALDMGYDVYFGINRENPEGLDCELPVHLFDSHTYRSITALKDNCIAYKNLSTVVKDGNVEAIHCNTPVGGMIGRLVGKIFHVKKVIYTAHGFHFYKGAPLFNRTVLKWAEQIMAHWTDAIITMNHEDYEAAQKFKLKKGGRVFFVHGVGITLSEYINPNNRKKIREELGLSDDEIVLISAGDLVVRKNYEVALRAIKETDNDRLHYLICGVGPDMERLKRIADELDISNKVHFLGYRNDMKDLFFASDLFLFTTLQEGLPRSMMEAMACGLPCVASKIRGNVDLLDDGSGGYLSNSNDYSEFARHINMLSNDSKLRGKMGEYNLQKIKEYDISIVEKEIFDIYKQML